MALFDQGANFSERHPFDALGLEAIDGFSYMRRVTGSKYVMFRIRKARRGLDIDQGPKLTGPPSRFFLKFPSSGLIGRLALLDFPDRDFPAPAIGDESVPPHQKYLTLAVDRHNSRAWRRADPAVGKMPAIGKFYVGQPYVQPFVAVQGAVRNNFPSHRFALTSSVVATHVPTEPAGMAAAEL
jgi:hypothetical protein